MPILKEECSLCSKLYSYYSLRRCDQCGRLYCRDCVTFTEDGNIICLNCARRRVSPTRLGTKYSPLYRFLARKARYSELVTLTFAQIDGIIGDNLPFSALRNQNWWHNSRSTAQGQAWLNVGWRVQDVNMTDRTVTFRRVAESHQMIKTGRKRRKDASEKMKKTLATITKPQRVQRKIPSKTRIAKAQARLKNIERKKSSMPQYRGKFRSRPVYEKRLYRPEAKPTSQEVN